MILGWRGPAGGGKLYTTSFGPAAPGLFTSAGRVARPNQKPLLQESSPCETCGRDVR